MKILKEGNEKWDEQELWCICPYCSCKFSGTVKDGDFSVVNDESKMNIAYKGTCPTCSKKVFLLIKY